MLFRYKTLLPVLLTGLLLPQIASALVAQSIDKVGRSIYESGYENKQKNRIKHNAGSSKNSGIQYPQPDYSSPVRNNMTQGPDGPVIAVGSGDSAVDYEAIADHLFGEGDDENLPYVVTFPDSKKSIIMPLQKIVEVKLKTGKNIKWNYDPEPKNLKFIRETREGNVLTLVYEAVVPGKEKLYFDSLKIEGDKVDVIESKVLNVRVK